MKYKVITNNLNFLDVPENTVISNLRVTHEYNYYITTKGASVTLYYPGIGQESIIEGVLAHSIYQAIQHNPSWFQEIEEDYNSIVFKIHSIETKYPAFDILICSTSDSSYKKITDKHYIVIPAQYLDCEHNNDERVTVFCVKDRYIFVSKIKLGTKIKDTYLLTGINESQDKFELEKDDWDLLTEGRKLLVDLDKLIESCRNREPVFNKKDMIEYCEWRRTRYFKNKMTEEKIFDKWLKTRNNV